MGETLVIANPASAGGRTARVWPEVEAALRAALGPVRVEWTRGPGDAERLAREGARAGATRLLAAGGDGTANEVANGLLDAGLGAGVAVGLLPLGTGSDLARALGLGGGVERAVAAIASGERRRVDVGRVSRGEGAEGRYFLNVAGFGLAGEVVAAVARRAGGRRGRLTYLGGALRALAGWRDPRVRIALDGRVVHDGPLSFAAAANGRYFGGGMLVAPGAVLDDGLLDLVVVPAMSRRRLVANLPRIYRGTHTAVAGVSSLRGRRVEVDSDEPVWIEADGDPLFRLPARIDLLPSALDLFVGPATALLRPLHRATSDS